MNHQQSTSIRANDLLRHLQDIRTGTYEVNFDGKLLIFWQ